MNVIKTQRKIEQQKAVELLDFKEYLQDCLNKDIFELDEDNIVYKVINRINQLPIWQQNLIYLYAIYGSYAKVAKHLNLSVGIVYKYTHNIIKKIHEHIS